MMLAVAWDMGTLRGLRPLPVTVIHLRQVSAPLILAVATSATLSPQSIIRAISAWWRMSFGIASIVCTCRSVGGRRGCLGSWGRERSLDGSALMIRLFA